MLEITLIVHGRVQGVGYRYSILEKIESEQLMLRGYVTNLPNGTVKIVGQGDIETLKSLRKFALEGSSRALVRDIEEVIQDISEYSYSSFDII